jgi:ferrochelatase
MRQAVVLFNLGGPDGPEAVRPFLFNLFNDKAIIGAPAPIRYLLARLISTRRAPVARTIYAQLGGASPLLANTKAQARALASVLGGETRVFVAMRYWHPLARETAREVKAFAPERVVLLPLYPQFSTTTTASSLADWHRAAAEAGLRAPTRAVCCYPTQAGFVAAQTELLRAALVKTRAHGEPRVLFSAHGLPKRVVAKGDPYPDQVEASTASIVAALGEAIDHVVCYQSRVGPLEWIGPETSAEIERAGRERRPLVVVPVAFVSEHSETLVELDIEYRHLAERAGVPRYERVATVMTHAAFIAGLAELVAGAREGVCGADGRRLCATGARGCAMTAR